MQNYSNEIFPITDIEKGTERGLVSEWIHHFQRGIGSRKSRSNIVSMEETIWSSFGRARGQRCSMAWKKGRRSIKLLMAQADGMAISSKEMLAGRDVFEIST